jgi:hypothetical protein
VLKKLTARRAWKSARTGGTRTDRIADITGRQFRASSSFPTQKKPDAKKVPAAVR